MEEDEIKILSTEDIYASLLTPEDHYTELNPAMVPANSQIKSQYTNSPGSMLDSTTKSFKSKVTFFVLHDLGSTTTQLSWNRLCHLKENKT